MMRSQKPGLCQHCKVRMPEDKPRHKLHEECIDPWLKVQEAKKLAKAEKERKAKVKVEKAEHRKALAAVRKVDHKKLAQKSFNAWVRLRDADLPCISCGVTNPPMTRGGQWDAGHFLSRGGYPEKRFMPDNCWKQCKSCNGGSRKYAHKARTVAQRYGEELLRRIGPERFEAVMAPAPPLHYMDDDYIAVRKDFDNRRKALEKERA